jgi:hypothetical protein
MLPFHAPMRLLREDEPFGTLSGYEYDTPWASAYLEAVDPAAQARCEDVTAFRSWVETEPDDLPDDESERRYEDALAARGLTEADLDWCDARWTIVTADGEAHATYALHFPLPGVVSWRW